MQLNEHKFKAALSLILLVYLAMAICSVFTLLPDVDEAWFTLPGYNLVENGFFGISTLDETANFRQVRLDGINRYTYWIMPAFPLVQAVWGKIFGFGLMQTRFVSIIFGILALISWTFLVKKLSGSETIALLTAGILAVDFHFVYAASHGRMDMMTVALGVAGLAAFASLREKNFDRAVLASCTLTALAFFTHPLGLLWFVSLTILIILLDFRRIKMKHLVFAAAPYLIFGLLWSIYIIQRPDLFFLQFGGNASDRWGFFRAPVSELWREITDRYFYNFGVGASLSPAGQIKILILAAYLAAVGGVLAVKSLREQILTKFLLLIALQEFLMLLLLDSMRQHFYMIYITPTLTAILAIWLNWLWTRNNSLRFLSFGILSAVILVHSGTSFLRFKRDRYHNVYSAAGEFLNQNMQPTDSVTASSEFWFVLNNKENLIDDYRLGFLTGKQCNFIIVDNLRYKDGTDNQPAARQYIENLLQNNYAMVYEDESYRIYKQKK